MTELSPCLGCARRYPGCHTLCGDYNAYRAVITKKNEERLAANRTNQHTITSIRSKRQALKDKLRGRRKRNG